MDNSTRKNACEKPAAGQSANGDTMAGTRGDLPATVRSFVESQLGLHPGEVYSDEHGSSITVTLKGVLSDSERNAAKDKATAELIARALTEAFRSVRGLFLARCSTVLGKSVEAATLTLDPQSNYASIILTVAD
ncbi:MAG: DUF2294 family protein [Chitinivibrionales bacterium]|nr:DUF2294 family protein [Chitinivibrionales bacterium]